MGENGYVDVDFQEHNHENTINGKPLYYSTSQVGQMVGETDSTIRFWCTKFKNIVKPEMSGSHRRFSEDDISKLKYIKKLLREEGYSINQVIEFAGNTKENSEVQIQKQEPLAMQALATALSIQIANDLEEYKTMIKEELINEIKNSFEVQQQQQETNKEEIKEYLAVAIKEQIGEISNYINSQELEAKKRDEEVLDILKRGMDERDKLNQQLQKEKKKGLFGWFKN